MAAPTTDKQRAGARRTTEGMRWKVAQGTLGTSSTALLTSGASGRMVVYSILLTEYSNNARTAKMRHIESGGTDDDTANFLTDVALAAKETLINEANGAPFVVLRNGDSIKGLASATVSVNYLINFQEEE